MTAGHDGRGISVIEAKDLSNWKEDDIASYLSSSLHKSSLFLAATLCFDILTFS